jgi:hypothetical protein
LPVFEILATAKTLSPDSKVVEDGSARSFVPKLKLLIFVFVILVLAPLFVSLILVLVPHAVAIKIKMTRASVELILFFIFAPVC